MRGYLSHIAVPQKYLSISITGAHLKNIRTNEALKKRTPSLSLSQDLKKKERKKKKMCLAIVFQAEKKVALLDSVWSLMAQENISGQKSSLHRGHVYKTKSDTVTAEHKAGSKDRECHMVSTLHGPHGNFMIMACLKVCCVTFDC